MTQSDVLSAIRRLGVTRLGPMRPATVLPAMRPGTALLALRLGTVLLAAVLLSACANGISSRDAEAPPQRAAPTPGSVVVHVDGEVGTSVAVTH